MEMVHGKFPRKSPRYAVCMCVLDREQGRRKQAGIRGDQPLHRAALLVANAPPQHVHLAVKITWYEVSGCAFTPTTSQIT